MAILVKAALIRRRLALVGLLGCAATVSPAQQPTADREYPVREVLAAFATACSGAEDTAVNLASVEAAGWERLAEDADTPVSQLSRRGAEALAAEAEAEGEPIPAMIQGGEFRKQVAGRTLYLAISGARIGDIISRGCRLFDFDAPRAFTDEELREWAVRTPNDRQELPGGLSRATFNPGLKPGHMEMEAYFVPRGAEPLPGIPLQGIGLVATAMEF